VSLAAVFIRSRSHNNVHGAGRGALLLARLGDSGRKNRSDRRAGTLVFVAAIPTLLMARIEGRPFGSYGLPRQGGFGKLFWAGAVWGIAALTALMLCMHWAGVFDFGSVVLHGGRLVKFAAFWDAYFCWWGCKRNWLFRGYPQSVLTEGVGFWPALFWVRWLSAEFISGIRRELDRPQRRRLDRPVLLLDSAAHGQPLVCGGFHAAWDWGESFLYSVPDSGEKAPGHLLSHRFMAHPGSPEARSARKEACFYSWSLPSLGGVRPDVSAGKISVRLAKSIRVNNCRRNIDSCQGIASAMPHVPHIGRAFEALRAGTTFSQSC